MISNEAIFVLYVKDQESSTRFYSEVFSIKPRLNVPGMTEFQVSHQAVLGLMPEKGIKRLLGPSLPDPELASGTPRAEVYLLVSDPKTLYENAIKCGAKSLSPLSSRDWGHEAAYCLDPDGHVLAFARKL